MNEFSLFMGIGHQTPTLSFPDYLHLSKNYFRLGWSSTRTGDSRT